MLNQQALNRLLDVWKNQCGIQKYGRMWVPIEGRLEAYKDLIKTLIEVHNYSMEELESSVYRAVMQMSIPPSSKGEKKDNWRKLATEDWNVALSVFFPEENQILKHDNVNDPVPGSGHRIDKKVAENEENDIILKNPINEKGRAVVYSVDVTDEEFLKELEGTDE